MARPDISLIEAADRAAHLRTTSETHPAVATQAFRAGLGRTAWSRTDGPMEGVGFEHWFQSADGALAYSREHEGRTRLIIFDTDGVAIADIRHEHPRSA